MIIKELSYTEFNDFNINFKHSSIYQTIEYATTMEEENFDKLILGLVDNKQILAATIVIVEKTLGFKYAYAPRGFLIDYSDYDLLKIFTESIKTYLSKKDIMAVKLNPLVIKSVYDLKNKEIKNDGDTHLIMHNLEKNGYRHLGFNNGFEALKPRFEAIINLDRPYEHIYISLKKGLKNKIRQAENNGIKIIKSKENNLHYLYNQTLKKYDKDLNYFENIYKNFGDNCDFFYAKMDISIYLNKLKEKLEYYESLSAKIHGKFLENNSNKDKIIAQKIDIDIKVYKTKQELNKALKMFDENMNEIIIATAIFIKQKDFVYMLMDGIDLKYKELNGKHLLIWRIIEYYNKLGYKYLNLGGITNFQINDKYDGLNQFKLSFDAKAYEYIGDFELVTNSKLYFMYKHTKPIKSILKI